MEHRDRESPQVADEVGDDTSDSMAQTRALEGKDGDTRATVVEGRARQPSASLAEANAESSTTLLTRPGSSEQSADWQPEGPVLRGEKSSAFPSRGSGSAGATSVTSLATSPIEALRLNELARTRRMASIVHGVLVISFAVLPLLGGDRAAKAVFAVGLVFLWISIFWLQYMARDPARYQGAKISFLWLVPAFSFCTAIYYYGVFSPFTVVIALAIYYIGLGTSERRSLAAYVIMAGFQAILSTLIIAELIRDRGLITAGNLSIFEQVVGQALVQSILLTGFLLTRSARREVLSSFEKLQKAARTIAQREAMVREVRQELGRAMRLGGSGSLTGQILGEYRLGVIIGRGGMGEVYRAENTRSGDYAAIKVLRPGLLDKPSATERFLREVEAMAAIDVPYVARVLEFGGQEAGFPYLAMELLRGHDLSHYLRVRGKLSPKEVVELVRHAASGLDAARACGIVHRDIKPQNLFLAEQPGGPAIWKILDFGISTLESRSGTLTQGRIVGTPGYMAPEQARGRHVDHRTDVYSLATIAYRALTGHRPFSGEDVPATLYKVVHYMPRKPSALVEIPSAVDAVLAVGLAKQPEDRFDSALELADALQSAVANTLAPEVAEHGARILAQQPFR